MISAGLDHRISKKVNETIVVSGSVRSGTTIMGKLIHSLQNVEYVLEPPTMYSLFSLLDLIEEDHWKLIYETYLYEEFLINALAGRSINCNRVDDSSIFNCKSEQLIQSRLIRSLKKTEAERLAHNSTIAYKTPSVLPWLKRLKKYYPGTKIVVMTRGATDVFNSILEKGWFTDEALKNENYVYPNHFKNGIRIPFWVKSEDHDQWIEMNELHRVAYYFIRMNKAIVDKPEYITVKYEDLLADPMGTTKALVEKLDLSFGEKTTELVGSVKRRVHNDRNYGILDDLDTSVRDMVARLSSKL